MAVTVLLIDDEPMARATLREMLEDGGMVVVEAVDGPDGIAEAHAIHPDVILLDVLMPGIDGFEVCQALKDHDATADIPVVVVTCSIEPAVTARAYAAGAIAYLPKPVRADALCTAVQLAVSQSPKEPRYPGVHSSHP